MRATLTWAFQAAHKCQGILINSPEALESAQLKTAKESYARLGVPVVAVGPLLSKPTCITVQSEILAILEAYRPDYLLDIYLQKHIPTLCAQIRNKCITQYLIAFSCVTLDSLDAAFGLPGRSLQEELASMIREGALQARIDTIDKVKLSNAVSASGLPCADYSLGRHARGCQSSSGDTAKRAGVDPEVREAGV